MERFRTFADLIAIIAAAIREHYPKQRKWGLVPMCQEGSLALPLVA